MADVMDGKGDRRREKADPRIAACPSTATLINDEQAGILTVIAAPDRLVISDGNGVILRLGAKAARALGSVASNIRWAG